jgi:hypothetical protein
LKKTEKFTHKGWFGICPVYLADLETDCPNLTPRADDWFHLGLYYVSHYAFIAFFTVADTINPSWQPGFPIVVTGELVVPYLYEYDDE